MWDPYDDFESTTLSNGLTVHKAHWPDRPWETVAFLVHSGAEQDPLGFEGTAHFVEHLVSQNVPEYPEKQIREFFENLGGQVKLGATGYTHTFYSFFAPNDTKVLEKALAIFGTMLFSGKLRDRIKQHRRIITGEFHRSYPSSLVLKMLTRKHQALYTHGFLSRSFSPLGSLESIKRITEEVLQSYYDKYYTPANMSVVSVGGTTSSNFIKLLQQSPLAMCKNGMRTSISVLDSVTPPSERRHVFEASKYTTVKVNICGYQSSAQIPGTVSTHVIQLLTEILTKILHEEVREKRNWAYSCGCTYQRLPQSYELSLRCPELTLEAIGEIEEVVDSCIFSLPQQEDLFQQIKQCAINKKYLLDTTGMNVRDKARADLAWNNKITSLKEEIAQIESITMDGICTLLEWLTPDRRWTLLTRP